MSECLTVWRPLVLGLALLAGLVVGWRRRHGRLALAVGLLLAGAVWLAWGFLARWLGGQPLAAAASAAGYEKVWLAAVITGTVGLSCVQRRAR